MFRRKIMVMDDDAAFSRLICDFFKGRYDVLVANHFDDAIKTLKQHRPKVVILDFNMPLVNGDQFLPLLQEFDPSAKAIVVTGCLQEEVEQKFRGTGYFAFFEKGDLSLEALGKAVDDALNY